MKILLVEDNRAISKGLVYTLEQNGFEVALCENAESTLNSLGGDFDLFIVDVSLPDGNGFELCDEIKRVCETPVIFLTALDDEDSIVKGFDLGAEDYITKPFSSRELLARIKRITKKLDKTMAMNFGDISIDFDKKQVCKNGNPVVLTALEYRLFAMLAKNSGKVLQVGAAARSMLGRTPGNVVAVHPLQDGVISDYELTARMLTEMLRRVLRHAGDETADILLLLGVGALLIDGMLRCQRSEALPAQLQVQKLLHRQIIEAQFIGEMCGDLAGRIACHKRVPFLSQFVRFS